MNRETMNEEKWRRPAIRLALRTSPAPRTHAMLRPSQERVRVGRGA